MCDVCTHRDRFSASFKVAGSSLPSVSGSRRATTAATTHQAPITVVGKKGCTTSAYKEIAFNVQYYFKLNKVIHSYFIGKLIREYVCMCVCMYVFM